MHKLAVSNELKMQSIFSAYTSRVPTEIFSSFCESVIQGAAAVLTECPPDRNTVARKVQDEITGSARVNHCKESEYLNHCKEIATGDLELRNALVEETVRRVCFFGEHRQEAFETDFDPEISFEVEDGRKSVLIRNNNWTSNKPLVSYLVTLSNGYSCVRYTVTPLHRLQRIQIFVDTLDPVYLQGTVTVEVRVVFESFRRFFFKTKTLEVTNAHAYDRFPTWCPMEPIECPICHEKTFSEEEGFLTTPCNHTFCVPCMVTWLAQNTTCPYCRNDLISTS